MSLYQSQFEALANHTVGISDSFLLNCFVFCLKPTIRRELLLARPKDMQEVVWLAQMHEDKFNDQFKT